MTLGAEIISKILRLREQDLDDLTISHKLGFDIDELTEHECSTLEAIMDSMGEGITDVEEIARELQMPLTYVYDLASEFDLQVTIRLPARLEMIKHRHKEKQRTEEREEGGGYSPSGGAGRKRVKKKKKKSYYPRDYRRN